MKVLFVGDNRNALNWGRGASIALHELLSSRFEITGTVSGDSFVLSTSEAGYVGTLMPGAYYRFFRRAWQRSSRRIFGWYIRIERAFGAHDFIADDPVKSVENLLAHKHRYPALAEIYEHASMADLLVVDGDGDIIFTTPPRRQTLFLLAMIELGIQLGKPVFLVNTMISDCPLTGKNRETIKAAKRLFAQCRTVAVRDPESLEYVQKEMPEAVSVCLPDSLFSWFPRFSTCSSRPPINGDFLLPYPERGEFWGKLDFSKPYICLGGGGLAATQTSKAIQIYCKLVEAIEKLGYPVYLTENDQPDFFLRQVAREKGVGIVPVDSPILMCGAVLAHARVFISGRYHPSIFASLGGTPCIFLGSQAHKMASLSRVLDYDLKREFDAFPNDAEIEEIVSTARKYLNGGDDLRKRIKEVASVRCTEASSLPELIARHMNG